MIICVILIVSMGMAVCNGFVAGYKTADNLVAVVVPAAILVLLFTMWFYGLRTLIAGFIVLAAAVLIVLVVSVSQGMGLFTDTMDNRYLSYILIFLISIGVFLLTRTGIGNAIMLAAGVFILCLLHICGGAELFCNF